MSARSLSTVVCLGCVALVLGCGGGDGGEIQLPDVHDAHDAGIADDSGPPPPECTNDEDCADKFDGLGQCVTYFCNLELAGGTCDTRPVDDGTVCSDDDPCTQGDECKAGECVPGEECECRKDGDCAEKFEDLGQCEDYFCDLGVDGGTCDRRDKPDEEQCDDGNPCTQGDKCVIGECVPGDENVCDCMSTEDCMVFEDDNLCNGTLLCDLQHFPYKCEIDPFTLVACNNSQDTFCKENLCVIETGECEMAPVHEGEICEDGDFCTKVTACLSGICGAVELVDCDDDNICTDDSCDSKLGCIHMPNTLGCNDDNACTEGDFCENSACKGGPEPECDDGVFCNGLEECDPETGCVDGEPPTCDDGNECTEDSCETDIDECEHVMIETAKEGPLGSTTCSDDKDNDCDGKTDENDPECSFGVLNVIPAEGPSAGGTDVTLAGGGFDMIESLVFAGLAIDYDVGTNSTLHLTTPPHNAGYVAVSISNGWVEFVLEEAFRYTDKSEDSNLIATFIAPASHTMTEGETLTGIECTVSIPGLPEGQDADPSSIMAQIGYGPAGSIPWADPSWTWLDLTDAQVVGDTISYEGEMTVGLGGYFNLAARFSVDGGFTFEFGDMSGSEDGYDPADAALLTVWGVPDPGEIVINELMWMGSNGSTYDEWFELRNTTRAPFDLGGFVLTHAAPTGNDFIFEAEQHTVVNLTLDPYGYFLVAEKVVSDSAIDVEPDIIGNNTLVLPNGAPVTYELKTGEGTVIDKAFFSGLVGYNGDAGLGTPDKSMERDLDPGNGTSDDNWHTAFAHEGWDEDPYQIVNWGTPGGPNSDIPLCTEDADCIDAYPEIEITECEKRVCAEPAFRCGIADIPDGEWCDDGLFCTMGDECFEGNCTGETVDCDDEDPCTSDECDDETDQCLNVPMVCDDADPCTNDSCDPVTGDCINAAKVCDDGNLCTNDSCDEETGVCLYEQVDCDDEDACTIDACQADTGLCSYIDVNCGDGDPCTLDSCDQVTGCQYEAIPDCTGCAVNGDCLDDSLCTDDTCEGGNCFHLEIDCSDDDLCTDDLCVDLTGDCYWEAVVCDDDNECTLDSCDPTSGACLFEMDPEKYEGPAGDEKCSDGLDNDCDGLTDGEDPQCLFAIFSVEPEEVPAGAAWEATISGSGLDIVTEVLLDSFPADEFTVVAVDEISAVLPAMYETGDFGVSISDGIFTLTLDDAVRVIDTTDDIWGNTQHPTDPIAIVLGESTDLIFGQVFAGGITDSGGDPDSILAQIGLGPTGSDPFTDGNWTWEDADWNDQCMSCGNTFEYMKVLNPEAAGDYLVGFRFSVDDGFHFAYGDLDSGSSDGWDPANALQLTVTAE